MLASKILIPELDLPSEEEYFRQIMLTSEIVWQNHLSKYDIDTWLDNFTGKVFTKEYERQLALHLLANFVFYNEQEVRHLCRTLYLDLIHQMLTNNTGQYIPNIDTAHSDILDQTSFLHLGKPGESGSFILYYFRQENNLPVKNFISYVQRPPAYVNTIVFVDDVTLSGRQASKYSNQGVVRYGTDKTTNILLTLISTQEAIDTLQQDNIQVISCIKLDDRNKCFSKSADMFHQYKNKYKKDCRLFAYEYGKLCLPHFQPLGYNNGQYAFGFFFNTPDNTLPIFWAESNNWSPIMKRYQKFSRGFHGKLGRFV